MLEIHLRTPQQYKTEHLYQYSIIYLSTIKGWMISDVCQFVFAKSFQCFYHVTTLIGVAKFLWNFNDNRAGI